MSNAHNNKPRQHTGLKIHDLHGSLRLSLSLSQVPDPTITTTQSPGANQMQCRLQPTPDTDLPPPPLLTPTSLTQTHSHPRLMLQRPLLQARGHMPNPTQPKATTPYTHKSKIATTNRLPLSPANYSRTNHRPDPQPASQEEVAPQQHKKEKLCSTRTKLRVARAIVRNETKRKPSCNNSWSSLGLLFVGGGLGVSGLRMMVMMMLLGTSTT